MRTALVAFLLVAILAIGVILSNLQATELVSVRWGPWIVFTGALPSAIVAALFLGAAVVGLPLLVANLVLGSRVRRLERTTTLPPPPPRAGPDAEATRRLEGPP
jgi:hypothetical protein